MLTLASSSPRRTEILTAMGIPHTVVPSTVDESLIAADHPRTFALRAAFAKAREVADRQPDGTWVLGADTVVTQDLLLFGKPRDAAEAVRTLRRLAGTVHQVITAIALVRAGSITAYLHADTTRVRLRPITDEEIAEYVATGEPMDKAGAYGIQGIGGTLIEAIDGSYFNVVGLPAERLLNTLEEAGLEGPFRLPSPPQRWRQ